MSPSRKLALGMKGFRPSLPPPLLKTFSREHTLECAPRSTSLASYKNIIDKFRAKGIDAVICVAFNDPYTINGWAEKLQAKEAIEFYGDFYGSFHKKLDLIVDISCALLGPRYFTRNWT